MPDSQCAFPHAKRIALSCSFVIVLAAASCIMSGIPHAVPFFAALLAGILAVYLIIGKKPAARILPPVLILGTLALLRFGIAYRASSGGAAALLEAYDGQRAVYTGYVQSDTAPHDTLYLTLTQADGKALSRSIGVYTRNPVDDYVREGDALTFSGILRRPQNGKNASFDFVRYLRFRGIYLEISSAKDASVNTICPARPSVGAVMRRFVTARLDELLGTLPASASFSRTFGLSKALLFGDKSALSDADLEAFRRCGITHILCVSGMHFSVVFGLIALILSFITSNPKVRRAVLYISMFLYLALCGFSLSAVRAAFMAAAGGFRGKNAAGSDGVYRLLMAAVLILLLFPYAALDVGFHLSFLATLGILCTTSCIGALPHAKSDSGDKILRTLLTFILVPVGAFVFTAPYSAAVFGGISTVGLIVSCMTVYPAELLLLTALTGVILCIPLRLFYAGAFLTANIMEALASFICRTAEHFAAWQYAYLPLTSSDHSLYIWLCGALLAAALNVHRKKRTAAWIVLTALVPLGIALAALTSAPAA